MCLTVLAVPDLDLPSNLVGSLTTSDGSHRARLPAGKGSKAGAPGAGCAQQAALQGCVWGLGWGWGWEGGGGEQKGKPFRPLPPDTHSSPRTHLPASPSFLGLYPQTLTLACAALLGRLTPSRPPPFQALSAPPSILRPREGGWTLAPAQLGLRTGWELPPEISASRGRGGELGEGAGQGRKRAGAVFVSALLSGTDGWGGERVRGGGEEWCGGRRMRNEEFRRPESPRRSPPPHLFPARVGASAGLSPREPGLWPEPAPAAQPAAPGRAPRPGSPPCADRAGWVRDAASRPGR